LNEQGEWKDIDDGLPSGDEIKKMNLFNDLTKEEKEFTSYLASFEYRLSPYNYMMAGYINEIMGGDLSLFFTLQNQDAYLTFYKKDSSGNILESYNPTELYLNYRNKIRTERGKKIMIKLMEDGSKYGNSYLWDIDNSDFFVRGGKVYNYDDLTNPLISESFEELDDLVKLNRIKSDLRKEC
jgi:hypothetical protein